MFAGRRRRSQSVLAQLLADILDMPVVTHKGGETGGALGRRDWPVWQRGNRWLPSAKPEVYQTGAPRLNAITP